MPNIVTLIRRHECHGNVLLYVQPPEVQKLIDEVERLTAKLDAICEVESYRKRAIGRVWPKEGESDG